jgi:hypothetical protein
VESSYELGNEPSGSIKCWELRSGCTTCGPSSGTQLHRVSYMYLETSPQYLTPRDFHLWILIAFFMFSSFYVTYLVELPVATIVLPLVLYRCNT